MKKISFAFLLAFGLILPVRDALAIYTRSPSGTTINSPVTYYETSQYSCLSGSCILSLPEASTETISECYSGELNPTWTVSPPAGDYSFVRKTFFNYADCVGSPVGPYDDPDPEGSYHVNAAAPSAATSTLIIEHFALFFWSLGVTHLALIFGIIAVLYLIGWLFKNVLDIWRK